MKPHRCAAAQSQVQGHDLCWIYSADSVLCKMCMLIISWITWVFRILPFALIFSFNRVQFEVYVVFARGQNEL